MDTCNTCKINIEQGSEVSMEVVRETHSSTVRSFFKRSRTQCRESSYVIVSSLRQWKTTVVCPTIIYNLLCFCSFARFAFCVILVFQYYSGLLPILKATKMVYPKLSCLYNRWLRFFKVTPQIWISLRFLQALVHRSYPSPRSRWDRVPYERRVGCLIRTSDAAGSLFVC